MVDHLLALGFDKNYVDSYGLNALWFATAHQHVELTMHLLRRGFSTNGADNCDTFIKTQSRIIRSSANLTIFRALVRLMMGVIRHRYWSPDGKGYQHAQQSFNNNCLKV